MRQSKVVKTLDEVKKQDGEKAHKEALANQKKVQAEYDKRK